MLPKFRKIPILVVAITLLAINNLVLAQPPKVSVRIVSDASIVKPGTTIRVGVYFKLPERAHIYWRNPGDSGLPTNIEWNADGADFSELNWPIPQAFEVEGLKEVFYGYENETLLFSSLTIPQTAREHIQINADVSWLLCLDDGVCIPGSDELTVTLPIGDETQPSEQYDTFDRHSALVPRDAMDKVNSEWQKDSGELHITLSNPLSAKRKAFGHTLTYFPDDGGRWTIDVPDSMRLRINPKYKSDPKVGGVLVLPVSTADNKDEVHFIRIPGPGQH